MSLKRVRITEPEYIRIKDAKALFSMSIEKITELAKECDAYFKIDKVVLIKLKPFREYIEEHMYL